MQIKNILMKIYKHLTKYYSLDTLIFVRDTLDINFLYNLFYKNRQDIFLKVKSWNEINIQTISIINKLFLPAEENHTRLGEFGCIRRHTRCTRVRKFTKKIQKYILNKFCSFTIMTYKYNIYNLDNIYVHHYTNNRN